MPRRIFIVVNVVLLLLMSWGTHALGDTAAERPAFREVIKGDEYNARLAEAWQGLPSIEELEASRMPLTGMLVIRLNSGYQARRLGIQVGDVIVSIDDRHLWTNWIDWGRTESEQTMRLVTRDGEERSFQIQPGLVGVRHIPYARPDLAYIRRADRIEALDREVLAGIMMGRQDPDLAETAWYHAVAGGYQADDLSDACGALIALYQSRPTVAADFAARVPDVDAEHPYRLYPRDRMQVAAASGRLALLLGLPEPQQQAIDLNVQGIRSLVEQTKSFVPPSESLIVTAAGMTHKDLMHDAIPGNDVEAVSGHNYFDELKAGLPYDMSERQGRCKACYVGFRRPSADVEAVVRFKMSAQKQGRRTANLFEVALVDRNYRRRQHIRVGEVEPLELIDRMSNVGVGIARDEDGNTQVYLAFGNQAGSYWYEEPTLDVSKTTEFEFRLVHLGDFAEAQINGVTVVRTPIAEPTRKHGLFLKISGADVVIHEVQVSALD